MQKSIDEFEFRMNEFSELLKNDQLTHDRAHKLQNDCKYFANLFADLLRENYKLKDQIIEHLRQISVYREELMKITFDVNQTTNEDRKFSKDMASIEVLVKYLVEDQKYFYKEKEKMLQALMNKEEEIKNLLESHEKNVTQLQSVLVNKKLKWRQKLEKQIQEGLDNIEEIKQLKSQIADLNKEIEQHLSNGQTYESEISKKDLKLQFYQKLELEYTSKQTDIDIKHDFAMKELQKKYRNEMKDLKIQNANNLKSLQNNYEDKFLILQKNAEVYSVQLEQKTYEFMQLSSQYEALISTYRDYQEKNGNLVKDLDNQLQGKQQLLVGLEAKYENLQGEHDLTKKQLKSAREEQYKQAADILNQQKEIKQLQLTIQSQENKIKEKTERFQRLTEQMNHDHDRQMKQQKCQMEEKSDARMSQLQKNAQEQYELLMRQKNVEISQLKTQLDGSISKFEQYQLIHSNQILKMEKEFQQQCDTKNESILKLQEEIKLKASDIQIKEQEISQFSKILNGKQVECDSQIRDLKVRYEEEINMLKDGVELLIKSARKPLDDKILSLTVQAEQKQNQYSNLQNQYNQLSKQHIDFEQRSQEKITSLQDEMSTSMNIFNKMNDNLTNKLQRLLEQIRQLEQQYSILNEQIQQKNKDICQLQQSIQLREHERNQENHKHQKIVKELQIYIGNKEIELSQIQQQYIESLGQLKQFQSQIKAEKLLQIKERETLLNEKQQLEKQVLLKGQEIITNDLLFKKNIEKYEIRIRDIQIKYEESCQNILQHQNQVEKIDKIQQTELFLGHDRQVQCDGENIEDILSNIEALHQKDIAELIIKYESLLDQLQQDPLENVGQDNQKQRPQIQIIEKIIYKEAPKKESPIQGLDVLLKQTQFELEESRARAQIEKEETDNYINQLNFRFQVIFSEHSKEVEDLNDQILKLKDQLTNSISQNNQLKQEIIEQNLKFQLQIQTLSQPPPSLSTENMLQKVEQIKQDIESTKHQIKPKTSENSLVRENFQDDRQISHLSDYSELNSKLQLDSKLPTKRKKLPKMMNSMKSNFSDAQQSSSHNQTQRMQEEKQEVPAFRFDQEDQVIIDAPISYNVFIDQKSQETQQSSQRQNKYTVYIEKKKKDMINISDIVQQQQQISPADSRLTKKKQENQQPKKFVPYYLRNPDATQRQKLPRRDAGLKLNGNTFN